MSHEVDRFGYPVDPELHELESYLGDLAAQWRTVARGLEHQDDIVSEYHDTLKQMFSHGWRGSLDVESELPDALLPAFYLEQDFSMIDKQLDSR